VARVRIEQLRGTDEADFLELTHASREHHRPWTYPPLDAAGFAELLVRGNREDGAALLVRRTDDDALVGVFVLNQIVRRAMQSAYLGYYGHAAHARRGYMREGLGLVLDHAFGPLGLHRLEANIQPGNAASIALVRALGFRREGFSPRYLKIGGRWRDHERWAILAEDWRALRRRCADGGSAGR
jgi:ribosomal-protein-alanine N-acetyltransferase